MSAASVPTVVYQGHEYQPRPGETLLKLFQRVGVSVPFSCGGGVCHVCLHRCVSGSVPPRAQKGLRTIYRERNYLLLCLCVPEGDMEIQLPGDAGRFTRMSLAAPVGQRNDALVFVLDPHTRFSAVRGDLVQVHVDSGLALDAIVDGDVVHGEPVTLAVPGVTLAGLPEAARDIGFEFEVSGPFARSAAPAVTEALERPYPEPDLDLWRALDDGVLLSTVLNAFYPRIFADPVLGPYFRDTTVRRLAEKQYNFLRQAITGEKVFFGERPRNSHHWMVISDEIFERRSRYLVDTMKELGVREDVIARLMAIEDRYREDIVKDKPWNKVLFGKEIPVEGFESLVLDAGTTCDSCGQGIQAGESAIYHVRTGKLYCCQCQQGKAPSLV